MTELVRLVFCCRDRHGVFEYSHVASYPVEHTEYWWPCPICGLKQRPIHEYRTLTLPEAKAILAEAAKVSREVSG